MSTKLFRKKLQKPGIVPFELDEVAEFHELTKSAVERDYFYVDNAYKYLFEFRGKMETQANKKNYFSLPDLPLPEVDVPRAAFNDVLSKRRSVRDFTGQYCSMNTVSEILSSCRSTRQKVADSQNNIVLNLRPYPSPGALYPNEIYIALIRVEDQKQQICHFNPIDFRLTPITIMDNKKFWPAVGVERNEGVKNCSICIIISSLFERTVVKYGPLGYRFSLLESGIITQQLILATAASGLDSLAWGGYFDDELNSQIGVDSVCETVTSCLFIGYGE